MMVVIVFLMFVLFVAVDVVADAVVEMNFALALVLVVLIFVIVGGLVVK